MPESDPPATTGSDDGLADLWEWFAVNQFRGYSPLYERIALAVAADDEVLGLVRQAPPTAHLPPVLLGAVHFVVLGSPAHPLAEVYAGRSDRDPVPLFLELCRTHRDQLGALLSFRQVQTNDCGRSALIAPGLSWITARHPGPFALVDVGASAGLNLLCDRYRLDYGGRGATGPADSAVTVECEVLGGDPPIVERLAEPAHRIGVDRSPVDLSDPDDARWLLACVWPDTGRLERTAASIQMARQGLPAVREGDACDLLPRLLDDLDDGLGAVVMTTWAFSYFSSEDRQRFAELVEAASWRRPIAWLSADGAGTVPGVAEPTLTDPGGAHAHVLGAVLIDRGVTSTELLAVVQQHGAWLDWRAPPG